jgi:hypothetical protein
MCTLCVYVQVRVRSAEGSAYGTAFVEVVGHVHTDAAGSVSISIN